MIPHLHDRAGQLAALGWTGREADWIALVCLHSGVFTRSQWCYFFEDHHRMPATRFVRALVDRGMGVEDERPRFPGRRAGPSTSRTSPCMRRSGFQMSATVGEPRTRPPKCSCGGYCRSITSSSG